MRLIDADELVRTTDELSEGAGFYKPIYEWFSKSVKNQPTIDAVPVVHCRECKHWKPTGSEAGDCFENMEPIGGCRWVNFCRKASDFCSYGERKVGEG